MDKNSPSKWTFRTFECLGENSPNSSCQIWKWSDKSVWTLHLSSMSWEITLLYFFSWNFMWFLQKEPIKVQNLRLDWSGEIWPNLYCLVRLLLLKVYKISAKKVQRSYIYLMIPKSGAKFEENPIFCFKNEKNFDPSTQKPKNFTLWLVPFVQSACLT